ncbi:MAG: hypothetical protein JXR63_10525 [Spirochaetales bacterium]|nr:hypothetical protein [Spirochaetales bacterium]
MKNKRTFLLLSLIVMTATSCIKPYQKEIIEEIAPNETAFMIPLEGGSKDEQAQFGSIEFLESKKVATKRVIIPTRWFKEGRGPGNGRYIQTAKLIKIDRAPVSREWTTDNKSGSSSKNEGFRVESQDSIEFTIGGTCTAQVEEKNTATFLYYYAGKSMEDVMDKELRRAILSGLSREFAMYPLSSGRAKKSEIFDKVAKNIKEDFAKRGITITTLGISGGMDYTDSTIQDNINKEFASELAIKIAENKRLQQEKVNQMEEEKAASAKRQAWEFARAKEAQVAKTELEIELIKAQAMLEFAKGVAEGKVKLPDMVPQGANMLFDFGK